jgi:hypothetical protein
VAYDNPPFTVRRGDDRLIEIDVVDADGADVDLSATGTAIRLTYGKGAGGAAVKTITEADLTVLGKTATYRMRSAESQALEPYRTYWMQCRVTFPDGQDGFVETVTTGSFTVEQTQG